MAESSDKFRSDDVRERALLDAAWQQEFGTISADGPAHPRHGDVCGRRIGRYTLLREIGRGGMGVVYEAEQTSPRRRVAIKIVRGGFIDPRRQERLLQREADALARLRHADIAAIYEAGKTEDGLPYFAMEFVDGRPLQQFVAADEIPLRGRLELFGRICRSVAYAHGQGVLHRDLKPSNIVVDDAGNPKVLDFGLARLTDADVAATSMITEAGQIQGTLAYMSPEQTRANPSEIDARSDVYSLGVMLYELILDEPPYSLADRTVPDAIRTICEDEPRRMTTVQRSLSGDLNAITLKALEKDSSRRYPTADALADDIERYLRRQPIQARPPSTMYQLSKLIARNPAPFAAAGIIVLLILTFSVAMTVLYARSQRNLDRALQAEALAEQQTEKALSEAETAQRVSEFLVDLFRVSDPTEAQGTTITVREVLDRGADRIRTELADQPVIQAHMMDTIGRVYRGLGLFEPAESLLDQALALRRTTLGDEHVDTIVSMNELGRAYLEQGRWTESESLLRETVRAGVGVLGPDDTDVQAAVSNLAVVLKMQGKLEEAEPFYRRAADDRVRTLGEDHPDSLTALANFAIFQQTRGKLEEARVLHERVLAARIRALGNDHPMTLNSRNGIALLLLAQGEVDASEDEMRLLIVDMRRVFGDEHRLTLKVMNNHAHVLTKLGRCDEAVPIYRDLIRTHERVLGSEHPEVGYPMLGLSNCLLDRNEPEEASSHINRVQVLWRNAFDPASAERARVDLLLGRCLVAQGKRDEAAALLETSIQRLRDAGAADQREGIEIQSLLAELQQQP